MKKIDGTLTLITSTTVFVGVGIIVFILENMGIHGWTETMLVALSGAFFAVVGFYIYEITTKIKNK